MPRVARDLGAFGEHHHVLRRAPHLDVARHPRERHRVAPSLEAHQTVARHAPRDDDVERIVHGRHGAQERLLGGERLGDRGARDGAASAREQLVGARVERLLQRLDGAPVGAEQVGERAARVPHAALYLALVRAGRGAAWVHAEAARAGERGERRADHGRRAGARRDPRRQIVDAHPERRAAVALEEGEVPRLPGELRHRGAHPHERRPAVRQGAEQAVERARLAVDARGPLEPVVLRLHARRRLDAPHGLRRWGAEPATQVPPDRLVAAREAVLAHEHLVQHRGGHRGLRRLRRLAEAGEHRVDALVPAVERRCPVAPPVGRVGRALEAVAQPRLGHPELAGHLPDRGAPLDHLLCDHHLVPPQLRHVVLRFGWLMVRSGTARKRRGRQRRPGSRRVRELGCFQPREDG